VVRNAARSPLAGVRVRLTGPDSTYTLLGISEGAGRVSFAVRNPATKDAHTRNYRVIADIDRDGKFEDQGPSRRGDAAATEVVHWSTPAGVGSYELGDYVRVDMTRLRIVALSSSRDSAVGDFNPINRRFGYDRGDRFFDGLDQLTYAQFKQALAERPFEGRFTVDYRPGGSSTWNLDDPTPTGTGSR